MASKVTSQRTLHWLGHAVHPPAPLFARVYEADRASVFIVSCDHAGASCSDHRSARFSSHPYEHGHTPVFDLSLFQKLRIGEHAGEHIVVLLPRRPRESGSQTLPSTSANSRASPVRPEREEEERRGEETEKSNAEHGGGDRVDGWV